MLKSLEYSFRYMLLIVVAYYIFGVRVIYAPNFWMVAIIPINFLAINYGIFYKINKDKAYYKYDILMTLVLLTSIFNVVFLSLNKVNMYVILFVLVINILELVYLDRPIKNKIKKNEISKTNKNFKNK